MGEYIDREKIQYTWWQKTDGTFTDGVTFQSVIKDMPTEDVQKVKHGYWEDDEYMYICNICGKWLDITQGTDDMNYCPNCGAKMDGDSE